MFLSLEVLLCGKIVCLVCMLSTRSLKMKRNEYEICIVKFMPSWVYFVGSRERTTGQAR